jgi:hypothetical protein
VAAPVTTGRYSSPPGRALASRATNAFCRHGARRTSATMVVRPSSPRRTITPLTLPPTHAKVSKPMTHRARRRSSPDRYSTNAYDKESSHTVVTAWDGESRFRRVP